MSKAFKNALCLLECPDFSYGPVSWWHRCHRHNHHKGRHRVVFRDGGVREWNSGDEESELTKKADA